MEIANCKSQIANPMSAFTLIELLLVLAIIGISTAIIVPSFVQSMKGNRLRAATRSVSKAGRYARSIAVLKQKTITVTFNLTNSTIYIVGGDGSDNITRKLDRVTVEFLDSSEEGSAADEKRSIVYQTNGRCTPYAIRITGEDGSFTEVHVDALATAETETHDE